MSILLCVFAAILLWLGIDALRLSRHSSPPTQMQKDEMMFGKGHLRPISDISRRNAEKGYPFATASSTQFYGWFFVAAGLVAGWAAWESLG